MIKAAIFDLDGTLIDTERFYQPLWMKAANDLGYPMTEEDALFIRSLDMWKADAHFKSKYCPEYDFIKVKTHWRELVGSYIENNGIKPKPYAREALEHLRSKGIRVAIATGSNEEQLWDYLRKADLDGIVEIGIAANMVKNGKPDPDVYLYACDRLDERPEDCLAFEDSPNGLISAYRAGCKAVFVPDLTEMSLELKDYAYATISDLGQIKDLCE